MTRRLTDPETVYRDWLNGGRERAAIAYRKRERPITILWITSLSFFILAEVLHIIGQLVR